MTTNFREIVTKKYQATFIFLFICFCTCECLSAPGGDLQTLIDGDLVPLEGDVVHFVKQLVEGLAYLHERNIAHLDIKVKLKRLNFPDFSPFFRPFFTFFAFPSSILMLSSELDLINARD